MMQIIIPQHLDTNAAFEQDVMHMPSTHSIDVHYVDRAYCNLFSAVA